MEGETYRWHQVASLLSRTVDEAQEDLTSSGFVRWCLFIDAESEKIEKLDFYLAGIIAEVRRSWVKRPRKIQTKQFVIQPKPKRPKPTTEQEKQDYIKESKSAWGMALGVHIPGVTDG